MKTVEKRLLELVILGSLLIVAWSLPTLSKPTLAAPRLQTAEVADCTADAYPAGDDKIFSAHEGGI